jgi:hypothetical protein
MVRIWKLLLVICGVALGPSLVNGQATHSCPVIGTTPDLGSERYGARGNHETYGCVNTEFLGDLISLHTVANPAGWDTWGGDCWDLCLADSECVGFTYMTREECRLYRQVDAVGYSSGVISAQSYFVDEAAWYTVTALARTIVPWDQAFLDGSGDFHYARGYRLQGTNQTAPGFTAGATECSNICLADPTCVGANYARLSSETCHLFTSVTGLVDDRIQYNVGSNGVFTAYLKASYNRDWAIATAAPTAAPTPAPTMHVCPILGGDVAHTSGSFFGCTYSAFLGDTISIHTAGNPNGWAGNGAGCRTLCDGVSECVGFNYWTFSECRLYRQVDAVGFSNGTVQVQAYFKNGASWNTVTALALNLVPWEESPLDVSDEFHVGRGYRLQGTSQAAPGFNGGSIDCNDLCFADPTCVGTNYAQGSPATCHLFTSVAGLADDRAQYNSGSNVFVAYLKKQYGRDWTAVTAAPTLAPTAAPTTHVCPILGEDVVHMAGGGSYHGCTHSVFLGDIISVHTAGNPNGWDTWGGGCMSLCTDDTECVGINYWTREECQLFRQVDAVSYSQGAVQAQAYFKDGTAWNTVNALDLNLVPWDESPLDPSGNFHEGPGYYFQGTSAVVPGFTGGSTDCTNLCFADPSCLGAVYSDGSSIVCDMFTTITNLVDDRITYNANGNVFVAYLRASYNRDWANIVPPTAAPTEAPSAPQTFRWLSSTLQIWL